MPGTHLEITIGVDALGDVVVDKNKADAYRRFRVTWKPQDASRFWAVIVTHPSSPFQQNRRVFWENKNRAWIDSAAPLEEVEYDVYYEVSPGVIKRLDPILVIRDDGGILGLNEELREELDRLSKDMDKAMERHEKVEEDLEEVRAQLQILAEE